MAAGDIAKQVSMIGSIAVNGDPTAAKDCRAGLILEQGLGDPTQSVAVIVSKIDANIGYLAGYLSPALGNVALRLFHVEHPIFGHTIPDNAADALEVGQKLGKEYAKTVQAKQEAEKAAAFAAETGVMLPKSDEIVSSEDAKKALDAVRRKKEAQMAKKLADLEAKSAVNEAVTKALTDGDMMAAIRKLALEAEFKMKAGEIDLQAGNPALGPPQDNDW